MLTVVSEQWAFLNFQKTDITLKKAHNYLQPPSLAGTGSLCHTTVCNVTLSLDHKHEGCTKRAAAGEASTNFSLTQTILLKVVLLHLPGYSSEWQLSHDAIPWRDSVLHGDAHCPAGVQNNWIWPFQAKFHMWHQEKAGLSGLSPLHLGRKSQKQYSTCYPSLPFLGQGQDFWSY